MNICGIRNTEKILHLQFLEKNNIDICENRTDNKLVTGKIYI